MPLTAAMSAEAEGAARTPPLQPLRHHGTMGSSLTGLKYAGTNNL